METRRTQKQIVRLRSVPVQDFKNCETQLALEIRSRGEIRQQLKCIATVKLPVIITLSIRTPYVDCNREWISVSGSKKRGSLQM